MTNKKNFTTKELRMIDKALEFVMKQEIITDKFKKELKPIKDKIDNKLIIV